MTFHDRRRTDTAPIDADRISDTRLGIGVGLRNAHFEHILREWPQVDWFEAISENFMDSGGRPRAVLRRIAERYPVVLHGVSLSIGSTDPLDMTYLRKLKALADETSARWVSDHLCWTGMLGINSHDLLPLPLNEAALQHLIPRVLHVQEILQRPLVLENPSTYLRFRDSDIEEPQFLRALCNATDCRLLLDVNNVYVSGFNAGIDPQAYLDAFPFERVVQLHLAGHQRCGTHIIDTHDRPVCDEVLALFSTAWQRSGGAATLLEWDGDVPDFAHLHAEALRAREWIDRRAASAHETSRSMHAPNTDTALAQLYRPAHDPIHETVSNPLDFIVPAVMQDSHWQDT
jgi:uncharacterized protein